MSMVGLNKNKGAKSSLAAKSEDDRNISFQFSNNDDEGLRSQKVLFQENLSPLSRNNSHSPIMFNDHFSSTPIKAHERGSSKQYDKNLVEFL